MTSLPADNLDFAWDRPESADSLRRALAAADPRERLRITAWIMREARVDEAWQFLTLPQIAASFPEVAPMLGRRRPVWEYLLRAARELGRI